MVYLTKCGRMNRYEQVARYPLRKCRHMDRLQGSRVFRHCEIEADGNGGSIIIFSTSLYLSGYSSYKHSLFVKLYEDDYSIIHEFL